MENGEVECIQRSPGVQTYAWCVGVYRHLSALFEIHKIAAPQQQQHKTQLYVHTNVKNN